MLAPSKMICFVFNFPTKLPEKIAPNVHITGIGIKISPASVAFFPNTPWLQIGRYIVILIIIAPAISVNILIVDNVRLEKSASGINGSGDFFSMNKKIMNETTAKINRPIIVISPQFCLLLPVNNAYSRAIVLSENTVAPR